MSVFIFVSIVNAQEAVVSAGNYHENENKSISWTLGEVAIETFVAGDLILTQGFHQPTITVVSVEDFPGFDLKVQVYPNPATELLNVYLEYGNYENVTFGLYDMSGRLMVSDKMKNEMQQISFSAYPSGIYFLRMTIDGREAKSFKIVKQ